MTANVATNNQSRAQASFPILGCLGIAFIVLKLCGVIAWSWWWVLSPFWLPLTIVLGIVVLCALIVGLASFGKEKSGPGQRYAPGVKPNEHKHR